MDRALNAVGIIQARVASTRLPSKIFAPIVGGQPMLAVLAKRLESANIDWWLATTDKPSDNKTAEWGRYLGWSVFRGDVDDVLSRFTAVVRRTEPQWVIRVTADDPFTDGAIVRRLLTSAREAPSDVDVIGDRVSDSWFPLGYLPQAVRASALLRAEKEISPEDPHHRSHVTSYLLPDRGAQFDASDLSARPQWRWTVDTVEDLLMTRAVFKLTGEDWVSAEYQELVALCDAHPDVVALNAHVVQKSLRDG